MFRAAKCGPRRSAKNPDAYTAKQVKEFAIKTGGDIKSIGSKSKAKLCAELTTRQTLMIAKARANMRDLQKDKRLKVARAIGVARKKRLAVVAPARGVVGGSRFKPELCGPRRSKGNPNAYNLIQTKAFANAKGIRGKTKADLCRKLTEQRAAMIAKSRKNVRALRVAKMLKGARAVGDARQAADDLFLMRAVGGGAPPVVVPGPQNPFDTRLCGPVRSRANPDAYLMSQVKKYAKADGISLSSKVYDPRVERFVVIYKTKAQLCHSLSRIHSPLYHPRSPPMKFEARRCVAAKSKAVPDAYTLTELRTIAKSHNILNVKSLSKEELCTKLGAPSFARRVQHVTLAPFNEAQCGGYTAAIIEKYAKKYKIVVNGKTSAQLCQLISQKQDLTEKAIVELDKMLAVQRVPILENIHKMITKVIKLSNLRHIGFTHCGSQKNVNALRGVCAAQVLKLAELFHKQNTNAKKVQMLTQLGNASPVCMEAKCNWLEEFIGIYTGNVRFNFNSLTTKDANISNAVKAFLKKWCREAKTKPNPKQYFLDKLPDLFTRVQALLQDKRASDGVIDYTDIARFIYDNGPYMLQCEERGPLPPGANEYNQGNLLWNINLNNVNVNTDNQIRNVFGMIGLQF